MKVCLSVIHAFPECSTNSVLQVRSKLSTGDTHLVISESPSPILKKTGHETDSWRSENRSALLSNNLSTRDIQPLIVSSGAFSSAASAFFIFRQRLWRRTMAMTTKQQQPAVAASARAIATTGVELSLLPAVHEMLLTSITLFERMFNNRSPGIWWTPN